MPKVRPAEWATGQEPSKEVQSLALTGGDVMKEQMPLARFW